MSIDWFTFVAQIVNFLVLVALLRWLLYGPIVRAMQQREDRISSRLKEAELKQAEAEEKTGQYEKKIRELDMQREELLKDAQHEAHEEHQRLLREARHEVDQRREQLNETYRRERDDLLLEIRRQAGRMGVEAARHTITQLANSELEDRMWSAFASRLQELDDEQRDEITRHLVNDKAEVFVRSAFDVSEPWRKRLREMIRERFEHEAEISFERASDLICGLEVVVGGYSFGWNVREFLRDVELEFSEQLDQTPRT